MELYHLLVVEDDNGKQIYSLEANAYSLGRDPTNAIILHCNNVSRQHALILRMPIPGSKDLRFRIIDGSAQGKRSVNGITINAEPQTSWNLNNGDVIGFGSKIRATYLIRHISDPDLKQYIQSPAYRSIKVAAIDPKGTMVVMPKPEEETGGFSEDEAADTFLTGIIPATIISVDSALLKVVVALESGRQVEAIAKSDLAGLQRGDRVQIQAQPGNVFLLLEKSEKSAEPSDPPVPELEVIKLNMTRDAKLYRYCFETTAATMAGLNLSEASLCEVTNLIFLQNLYRIPT